MLLLTFLQCKVESGYLCICLLNNIVAVQIHSRQDWAIWLFFIHFSCPPKDGFTHVNIMCCCLCCSLSMYMHLLLCILMLHCVGALLISSFFFVVNYSVQFLCLSTLIRYLTEPGKYCYSVLNKAVFFKWPNKSFNACTAFPLLPAFLLLPLPTVIWSV